MHKKIYFGENVLLLTDEEKRESGRILNGRESSIYRNESENKFEEALSDLEKQKGGGVVWIHARAEEYFNELKNKLQLIQAAGGFVYTPEQEILFIFRRGKWDLPKGKLDEGETLDAAAIREVQEETGIHSLHLVKPLTITYHTYHQDGKHVLKESHWYLMESPKQPLVPQAEEDIEICRWIPGHEVSRYKDGSHGSIRDVIDEGLLYLGQKG